MRVPTSASLLIAVVLGIAGQTGLRVRSEPPPAKTKPSPRTDRYGDPLPAGAVGRLGSARFRTGITPFWALFSPDGKVLATWNANKPEFRLWDAATGRELPRPVFSSTGAIPGRPLAFSPDGKMMAVADGPTRLYDRATGKEVRQLQESPDPTTALAYAADGKLLAAGGQDGTVALLDATTGREVRRIKGPKEMVFFLTFSPDGSVLAAVNERSLSLWTVATGEQQRQLPGPAGPVVSVAFAPDGKLLAAAHTDKPARVWEVATGKAVQPLTERVAGAASIAFAPDGRLLAAGHADGTVRLVEIATAKEVRRLAGHSEAVRCLAFSPDGKKLTSAGLMDCTLRWWDVATGKDLRLDPTPYGIVIALAYAPAGKGVVSFCLDARVQVWDLAAGTVRRQFSAPHRPDSADIALSFDAKLLASCADDKTVALWDVNAGRETYRLPGGKVSSLDFSADGKILATAAAGGEMRLWDTATGKALRRLLGQAEEITAVALSPDGKLLASVATGGALRLRDARTGKELRRWDTGQQRDSLLVFSPDGQVLASRAGFAGPPHLWQVATGKPLPALQGDEGSYGLAFSPDSRLVATTSSPVSQVAGTSHVFEVATGQEVRHFKVTHGLVFGVAFAPDGLAIITGGEDPILTWDVTGRLEQGRLRPARPGPEQLRRLWETLGQAAPQAHQAGWEMTAAPAETVPFLQKELQPAPAPDRARIRRLVADLASARFAVRDAATRELEKLGDLAAPELRRAGEAQAPLETRRRAAQLLDRCGPGAVPRPQQLRRLRALAVLEHIGTPEAQDVLRELAGGAAEARLTQEARAALERLARRAAGS